MPTERYCTVGDCMRLAESGGLCSAHRKRKQRGVQLGLPMVEKFCSTWDRLHAAAIDLAEADSEDDIAYQRAEDRLRKAVESIVQERLRTLSPTARRMGA